MKITIRQLRRIIREVATVTDIASRRKRTIMVITAEKEFDIFVGDASSTASTGPNKTGHRNEKYIAYYKFSDATTGSGPEFNRDSFNEWLTGLVEKHGVTHVIITAPGNPGTKQIPVDEWMTKYRFAINPENDILPDSLFERVTDPDDPEHGEADRGPHWCQHCATPVGGAAGETPEEKAKRDQEMKEYLRLTILRKNEVAKELRRWTMNHPDYEFVKDASSKAGTALVKGALNRFPVLPPTDEYYVPQYTVVHRTTGATVMKISDSINYYHDVPDEGNRCIEVKWDLRGLNRWRKHIKMFRVSPEELRNLEPPEDLEATVDLD